LRVWVEELAAGVLDRMDKMGRIGKKNSPAELP
jgi:hypothetical protein